MNEMVFDELHVVSDLHFGGKKGFQIFNQAETLAATIRNIASFAADRKIGFVMNGDIVDFLAEEPPCYLDPDGAITKLERIFGLDGSGETAFHDIWCALQEFVATANRHLVLVLGNHDVELALPPVTEWLKQNLSKGNAAARGQIMIHFDGAGFACRVKDKKVLCVHGNEVDNWNFINYRQLLEVSQAMNRGQMIPQWDANAGTRLVIDIMNNIKQKYPMVDLLKPEIEAALPIVLVLDPSALKNIKKLLVVAAHLKTDEVRRKLGFLSTEDGLSELDENGADEEQIMADFMSNHFNYRTNNIPDTDDLLAGDLGDDETLTDDAEFLGPIDFFKSLFGKEQDKAENMRKALLDKLEKDTTFNLRSEDEFYNDVDEEFGNGMDYLIAGHTHLERAIERKPKRDSKKNYYFNSGTWIRLIHLKNEMLQSQKDFDKIWHAFEAGKIEALDEIKDLGVKNADHLILYRPTVVSIIDNGNSVFGRLCHASIKGEIGENQEVANSRLPAGE